MKRFLNRTVLLLLGVLAPAFCGHLQNYKQDGGIIADTAACGNYAEEGNDSEYPPLDAIDSAAGEINLANRHILVKRNNYSSGNRVTNSKRQTHHNFKFAGKCLIEREKYPKEDYAVSSAVFCRGIFSGRNRIHFLRVMIV